MAESEDEDVVKALSALALERRRLAFGATAAEIIDHFAPAEQEGAI